MARPGESPVLAQRAVSEEQEGSSQTILLARRTRTITLCSPGTRARLGALGVGRVRTLRAVGDSSGPSEDKVNKQVWKKRTWSLAAALPGSQGVSQGKESVLSDSGRAGEITAGVRRVRSLAFLSILCECSSLAPDVQIIEALLWRNGFSAAC